jgi:uncharacterized membrane protein YczE
MTTPRIEHRIRRSGLLIGVGLAIQMLMLLWTHPLSFMVFLLVGCPLVGIGMLIYLYSLVAHAAEEIK